MTEKSKNQPLPELLSSSTFLEGAALTGVGFAGALAAVSSSSSELESDEELSAFHHRHSWVSHGLDGLALNLGLTVAVI